VITYSAQLQFFSHTLPIGTLFEGHFERQGTSASGNLYCHRKAWAYIFEFMRWASAQYTMCALVLIVRVACYGHLTDTLVWMRNSEV